MSYAVRYGRAMQLAIIGELCRLVVLGSVGTASASVRLLGVARHVELGEQEEQREDVPGVNHHNTGRVRGAPVVLVEAGRERKSGSERVRVKR